VKDIKLKIVHVFLPFVIATMVTIIGYSALRWWLDIKLGILPIQSMWLDFMFPLFISYIAVSIGMNKRFQILNIEKENKDRTSAYKFAMALFLAIPLIISQVYISSALYDLNQLQSPTQLHQVENEKFFKIDRFNISQQKCLSVVITNVKGEYNEDLDFYLYYACPFEETNPPIFYGIKYWERIDNNITEAKKQIEYEKFIKESQTSFSQVDFQNVKYFQRVDYSGHLKGYAQAIQKGYPNLESNDQIILIPETDSFENRDDSTLKWFFIMLGIGFSICFLMVTIPAINQKGLNAFYKNENLYESSIPFLKAILIGIGENKGSAFLLLCNSIVFIVMLFYGLDFLYPTSKELFQFGGETKESVLQGEYWRLFTSMFVHRGADHIFSNLISLAILGYLLEPVLKSFKFITIYLLCGIISGIVGMYWYPEAVSVGASGAISGLFGLLIAFTLLKIYDEGMASLIWILFFSILFIQVFFAFITNNISHAGHLSGFVSGYLIGSILTLLQEETLKNNAKSFSDNW